MTREMTWRYARRGRGGAKFWRLAAAKGNDDDEDLRSRGTGGVCNDNKQDDNYTMHRNTFSLHRRNSMLRNQSQQSSQIKQDAQLR